MMQYKTKEHHIKSQNAVIRGNSNKKLGLVHTKKISTNQHILLHKTKTKRSKYVQTNKIHLHNFNHISYIIGIIYSANPVTAG